jgi:hypothetical protein
MTTAVTAKAWMAIARSRLPRAGAWEVSNVEHAQRSEHERR